MSLSDVYQKTKGDKVEPSEKVIYSNQVTELRKEVEALGIRVNSFTIEMSKFDEAVKKLEALKMGEFTEKHKHMKENYNNLVTQYNQFTGEIRTVVMDMAKRLNSIEAKF